MKKLLAALLLILLVVPPTSEGAPGLSKKERKRLKKEIAKGMKEGEWDVVGGHLKSLAVSNDKKTWRLMVKVVERSPRRYQLDLLLRRAAQMMSSRSVQSEIKNTVRKSKSARVRLACVLHLASKKEWKSLIRVLKDKDEDVAATAAWRLIDNQVEDAVVPMIDRLEKLEKKKEGIWDVLRNGLGQMLGGRLNMAFEYRSRWEVIQGQGGLRSVKPPKEEKGGGEMRSGVRLFGRDIECTRVVFILDRSGSMKAIDADAKDYNSRDARNSRVKAGAAGKSAAAKRAARRTRLARAKRALKKVLKNLPANYKVNIIAYSSFVKFWRSHDGDNPPSLHALTPKNREDACNFVDKLTAEGVTVTDTALIESYRIQGARCFYLLSDGIATHDGTEEGKIPTPVFIDLVDKYKDRHVAVHTLGFKGADRDMMQAVAKRTKGKYSDIE